MNDSPYHLASSSSAGETAAGLALGEAFFLEKRATVLKVAGLEGEGAVRVAPEKLRGLPSISETPREGAAVVAAREAMMVGGGGEGRSGRNGAVGRGRGRKEILNGGAGGCGRATWDGGDWWEKGAI